MYQPSTRTRSSARSPRRLLATSAGVLGLSSVLAVSAIPPAASAGTGGRIVIGAEGDHAALQRAVGRSLATHVYADLSGPASVGTLTNIQAATSWGAVAAAKPGSRLYRDMVRWANAVKAVCHPVMVTFHHEPETASSDRFGSSGDFIRAWRKIHDVFAAAGAHNADWVWTLSAYSFRARDDRRAANWYPGDGYVDQIGADPYNWRGCGPGADGWHDIGEILAPTMAFAKAHGKKVVLPEFASNLDPGNAMHKAQWIANAHQYFVRNRGMLRGVFYFNNPDRRCHWKLDHPSQLAAFRTLARDATFTSTY